MSDNQIPLRVIAEVSGHRSLEELQTYLEVRPVQMLGAVSSLAILLPVSDAVKSDFSRLTNLNA